MVIEADVDRAGLLLALEDQSDFPRVALLALADWHDERGEDGWEHTWRWCAGREKRPLLSTSLHPGTRPLWVWADDFRVKHAVGNWRVAQARPQPACRLNPLLFRLVSRRPGEWTGPYIDVIVAYATLAGAFDALHLALEELRRVLSH